MQDIKNTKKSKYNSTKMLQSNIITRMEPLLIFHIANITHIRTNLT